MGKWSLGIAVALLIAATAPAVATGGDERVLRVRYDTAAPGPFASAQVPVVIPGVDTPRDVRDHVPDAVSEDKRVRTTHVGGVDIAVRSGEVLVEIYVLDTTRWKSPGRVAFFGGNGQQLGVHDFCFHYEGALPAGTTHLGVTASTMLAPCPVAGLNHGPATNGQFVVSLRTAP